MTNFKPEGFQCITPYLTVKDLATFVKFAESGLGAQTLSKMEGEKGEVHHAEFQFDDSKVMAGEAGVASKAVPAMLYFYVENCDTSYKRALEAGAKSVMEPADQFYGDRNAAVEDKWGNQWWFATHKKQVSEAEIKEAMKNR